MGSMYGRSVRTITAISGILASIGMIAMQFKVSAIALGYLFGTNNIFITVVAGSIVIIYSALGGIRAVTFTDILQFIVLGIFVPLLALKIWYHIVPASSAIKSIVQNPNMSISALTSTPQKSAYLIMGLVSIPMICFSPPMFQRLQMAKDVYQARKSFLYAAFVSLPIIFFIVWITLLVKVEKPNALNKLALLHYLFTQYATPGFKGIMAVGFMAMVMSTADSVLNAATVLLVHDLAVPFGFNKVKKMTMIRLTTLLLGSISVFIALTDYGIIDVAKYARIFYIPVVIVPLFLGLFGFRSSPRAVLIGMGAGSLVAMLWPVVPALKAVGIRSVEQGMLANLLFLVGSHYLLGEPGGWVGIKQPRPLKLASKMRKWWWKHFIRNARLMTLHDRLVLNLPRKDEHYFLIGLYAFLSNYLSLYGLTATSFNTPFFQGILYTMLLATSLLMTYPAWPAFMKSTGLSAWAYPLLLTYVFFVATPIIACVGQLQDFYFLLLIIHSTIAILLFPSWLLLPMMVLGTTISVGALKVAGVSLLPAGKVLWQGKAVYIGLMFLIFFLVLLRHQATKQKLLTRNYYHERLQKTMQEDSIKLKTAPERFVTRLGYGQYDGLNKIHTSFLHHIDALKGKGVDKDLVEKADQLADQIKNNATYLDQMMHSIDHSAHIHAKKIVMKSLLNVLSERHASTQVDIKLMLNNSVEKAYFYGDRESVEDILAFLIYKMTTITTTPYIFLSISPTQIIYPEAVTLYDALAFSFTNGTQEAVIKPQYVYKDRPATTLSPASTMADQHYGYFDDSKKDEYTFVLPQDIRLIRPNIREELPKSLDNAVIMEAKEVEGAFWASLRAKDSSKEYNLSRIMLALKIMKATHGYQTRQSGELFYTHPLHVATKVLAYSDNEDALITALLHDTVEDTDKTMEEVGLTFGKRVQDMTALLTNLKSTFKKYIPKVKAEKVFELFLANDPVAGLVKLCDRWHNMSTLDAKVPKKRILRAQETIGVYVPLARKLGFDKIADELEALCKPWLTGDA